MPNTNACAGAWREVVDAALLAEFAFAMSALQYAAGLIVAAAIVALAIIAIDAAKKFRDSP